MLALLVEGLPNKLIARRLEISEKTVKSHLTRIFREIGVTDRTQAALWAERKGLGAARRAGPTKVALRSRPPLLQSHADNVIAVSCVPSQSLDEPQSPGRRRGGARDASRFLTGAGPRLE